MHKTRLTQNNKAKHISNAKQKYEGKRKNNAKQKYEGKRKNKRWNHLEPFSFHTLEEPFCLANP